MSYELEVISFKSQEHKIDGQKYYVINYIVMYCNSNNYKHTLAVSTMLFAMKLITYNS